MVKSLKKQSRLWLAGTVVGIGVALPAYGIQLEQFLSYPSTRAMGMAGAFLAQANDSSAIWYNPAGLGHSGQRDLSIEQGSGPTIDETAGYGATADEIKFVGFSGNSKKGGLAAAYIKPYSLAVNGPTLNRIDVDYELLAFGAGFGSKKASFGYALYLSNATPDYNSGGGDSQSAFDGAVGLNFRLVSTSYLTMNVSAMYRLGSDFDFTDYSFNTAEDDELTAVVPDIPSRTGYGVNLQIPVPAGLLHVNAEKVSIGETYQGRAADRTAYGVEALFSVLPKMMLTLRAGSSETAPKGPGPQKMLVSAYGVGIAFNQAHFLDFAQESRKFGGAGSEAFDYTSLSYSFQF